MSPYVQEFRIDGGIVHARLSGTYPNERLAIKENLFKPLCRASDQLGQNALANKGDFHSSGGLV
jgi:hypothetical protein